MNREIEKAQAALENANNIVLSGHANPDGDCIGAVLAMAQMLSAMGKKTFVLLEPFGNKYNFLPGQQFICNKDDVADVDVFMALDCGTIDRISEFREVFDRAGTTINIDHHVSNENFADVNIVETEISSTCELLYHVFLPYYGFDKDVATCLYAGIIYDTGGFLHNSTMPSTHQMASDLLKLHIDHTNIYKELFLMTSFAEGKLLGEALSHMGTLCGGKIIYSKMPISTVKKHGGSLAELDNIISYLTTTRGADLAVFVYEKDENESKVSLRSNSTVDVAQYAVKNGGGGHVRAAGFSLSTNVDEALKFVLNDLVKFYE